MGQPDSSTDPRGAFAELFSLLYAQAGNPTLERVAKSARRNRVVDARGRPIQISPQRISDWRRGTNVPARFSSLAAVVEFLIAQARANGVAPPVDGLFDMDWWKLRWHDAVTATLTDTGRGVDTIRDIGGGGEGGRARCPYRGLSSFREVDAPWFFGRDRSVKTLVDRLRTCADIGGIVMLVGPSGVGKSSLLCAGLCPAVRQGALGVAGSESWPIVTITPGADPIAAARGQIPELADCFPGDDTTHPPVDDGVNADEQFAATVRRAIAAYGKRCGGEAARPIIIVDQFEELFTSCRDDYGRWAFIRFLSAAGGRNSTGGRSALVVIGLRADFYGQCLAFPELENAIQSQQVVLGPMTTAELRDAVTGPARAAGLQLEAGLVDLILTDVGLVRNEPRSGHSPSTHEVGALPLLSHCLLATWQRRKATRLTIAGYRAAGGIRGAVAATAENAWTELGPSAQEAARAVLLRLVHVGHDAPDTRRRATRAELVNLSEDPDAAAEVLETLARSRLITLDEDGAEITHEALLHAWPRLREWIDRDRAGNLLRQRLEEDATAWTKEGRDRSLLYRGLRLDMVRRWERAHDRAGLSATAAEFLRMSTRHSRLVASAWRVAMAAVLAFAILAAGVAVLAFRQRNDAIYAQIVTAAEKFEQTDPTLSAWLGLAAHRMRPDDPDSITRLLSTQSLPLARSVPGHAGAIYLTSFTNDGRTLATAGFDKTVRLWSLANGADPHPLGEPLRGHSSWVTSAVFSPDNRTLATAGDDGTIRLWDVSRPSQATQLGEPVHAGRGTIYLLAFSPDGRTLAAAGQDHTATLWRVGDNLNPVLVGVLAGHSAAVRTLAFSPDGELLATAGDDRTVRMWRVGATRRTTQLGAPLVGHTDTVHSVAFDRSGSVLASGSEDRTARLWAVRANASPTPLGLPLIGHGGPVWSVAFNPDSRLLVSGSADGTARVWNLSDPTRAQQIGPPLAARSGIVYAVAFSPDGKTVATGGDDGVLRLWSLPSGVLVGHRGSVLTTALAQDGGLLASGDTKGDILVWDRVDRDRWSLLDRLRAGAGGSASSLAFNPVGTLLASGSGQGVSQLWKVEDLKRPVTVESPAKAGGAGVAFSPDGSLLAIRHEQTVHLWELRGLGSAKRVGVLSTGHSGYITSLAFSPNSRTLVTGSFDATIRLWNIEKPAAPVRVGQPLRAHEGPVWSVAVSPDGRVLATAGGDNLVRLWDIADPSRGASLAAPLAAHTDVVASLAFSPDGETLASGSYDKSVRLWVLSSNDKPRLTASLLGHTDNVTSLIFDPDRDGLITGSIDGTIRLWDLEANNLASRICAAAQNSKPKPWSDFIPEVKYRDVCG